MWYQVNGVWTTDDLLAQEERELQLIESRKKFPWEVREWVLLESAKKRGPPYWLFSDFKTKLLIRYKTKELAKKGMLDFIAMGKSCTIVCVTSRGQVRAPRRIEELVPDDA